MLTNRVASELLPIHDSRPHVVILGAGASRACCLNGDRHGRILPVFADFTEVVGLGGLLASAGIVSPDKNFETLCARLEAQPEHARLCADIEAKVVEYFSNLALPDEPTIYDRLLAGLRPKDVVATFNWDPLLMQAARRCCGHGWPIPQILWLHGGIGLGDCDCTGRLVVGEAGKNCPHCGGEYRAGSMLLPTTSKDYRSDRQIRRSWHEVSIALEQCRILTVFGYSAPTSDLAAIRLMRKARGSIESRVIDQVEIIDVADESLLLDRWAPFICRDHVHVCSRFDDSLIGINPRRTIEAHICRTLDMECVERAPIPAKAGWFEMIDYLGPMVARERLPAATSAP